MSAPVLSVVVLSWNTRDLTLACLRALDADERKHSREVVVIDNGSEDGSADAVAEFAAQHPAAAVRLVRNAENRGYAAGNNQGAEAARGRYVCLLNSDTEVHPGALDQLVDYLLEHPRYGAVAPRLVNPDGSVQPACMRFPGILVALCFDSWFGKIWPLTRVERRYHMRDFDHLHSRDVDQPPGACFAMQREEYLRMGGLDPDLFLFFNDVDLCRRLWRDGRRIHYLAEAVVVHHGGASTKGYAGFVVTWFRNRIAYYRKHYGRVGERFLRLIVRWRAFEEWVAAGRRHDDPKDVAAERAQVKQFAREILAP